MVRPNYTPDLIARIAKIESDIFEFKRRQAGLGGGGSSGAGDDFWITTGKINLTGIGQAFATVSFGAIVYPLEPIVGLAVWGDEVDIASGARGEISIVGWEQTGSGGYSGASFHVSRTGGTAGTIWTFLWSVEEFA